MNSSYVTYDNLINANTELAAKNSAYILLSSPSDASYSYGKAVIEWENNSGDDDTVAIVAYAVQSDVSSYGGMTKPSITINGGNPF